MRVPRFLVLLLTLASLAPWATAKAREPAGRTPTPLSLERWDGVAVARALFEETNRRRADAGLPALLPLPAATAAAQFQADFMARTRTLTHSNPAAGQRSVGERLRAAGAPWRSAAENVLYDHLLAYQPGKLVYPRPTAGGGQEFSYLSRGPALPPHTLRSFARAALDQWMNSPGHRRNILSRDFTHLGCAATPAATSTGDLAGLHRVYAAQVFLTPTAGATPGDRIFPVRLMR